MPTREQMQGNFERALRTMDQFAAGEAPVQKAARKVARALDSLGIPYAVAGGLAVAANGVERQTVDVERTRSQATANPAPSTLPTRKQSARSSLGSGQECGCTTCGP